jgi:beta-galactosidase
MVHGGTSFGFTAGANCPPFSPQVTSYDYDAPISEAGWDTTKFHAIRELFLKHLSVGETLPEVPPRNPVVKIDAIEFNEAAPLFANLPQGISDERPKPMELYDQPHGCILYRTRLPAGGPGMLRLTELHDYGLVFLDGKKLATLDRRRNQNTVQLPGRTAAGQLDLLIDTFGHVNYGGYLHDRKGITEKVELVSGGQTNELTGWEVFNLPFEQSSLSQLKF